MNENKACWSQVHVTAFQCLRFKLKKGVNRRPKPILQGGGPGSHPSPNHLIGTRTVNTTLAKCHHALTRCTARNLSIFSHSSSTPINYTLLLLLAKTTIAMIDSRRIFCNVGYNREDFSAVWDKMEEKLLHYEIQWKKILSNNLRLFLVISHNEGNLFCSIPQQSKTFSSSIISNITVHHGFLYYCLRTVCLYVFISLIKW
jgi:hypothetical protein